MARGSRADERAPPRRSDALLQLHCRLVATWRCPHCDTPQTDGARCWACSRHPLACGTCRNYVKAVAGRLGYCALDRTRAVLQGDEIRACWQAPSRPEPFEGLFRDLDPGGPVDDPPTAPLADAGTRRHRSADALARDSRGERDLVVTRTWAIPIVPDAPMPGVGGAGGLRDATPVPARPMTRAAASDDPELRGLVEDLAIAEDDPHADEAVAEVRAIDDAHP